MMMSFQAENYAEFADTLSILKDQLNRTPHIVTVEIQTVEDAIREAETQPEETISDETDA